jgi:carbamoyl-phosphate synthase large subunit
MDFNQTTDGTAGGSYRNSHLKSTTPSKTYNIAITGVGGGVGQSILKSLYDTPYNIVGLDGEALGTGLFAVPNGYRIPYARQPEFIDRLLDICKKENIHLLFPGLDAELMPLALNRQRFADIGTTVIVSDPSVIAISDDKQLTYECLAPHGISVPRTMLFTDFTEQLDALAFPLIIKQKVGGARSKNVYLVKNTAELDGLMHQKDFVAADFIAQEYIEGEEFTCGSVNLDGACKGVIVMKRTLRDGDTYKCFSVKNEMIEAEVYKIMSVLQPFGACNVQLRVKDGKPFVFEINARCSGTTAARTLCGFNEPKMIADYLLHSIAPQFHIKEQTILRFWKELVVDNDKVAKVSNEQEIHLKRFARI